MGGFIQGFFLGPLLLLGVLGIGVYPRLALAIVVLTVIIELLRKADKRRPAPSAVAPVDSASRAACDALRPAQTAPRPEPAPLRLELRFTGMPDLPAPRPRRRLPR